MNRIVDVFPSGQQSQIRTQLSFVLEGVFCQQLLRRDDKKGRCLAAEVMVPTAGIRANIRDDKVHQIYSIMQTSGKAGMRTMNQSLVELYRASLITLEDAMTSTLDPDDLRRMLHRGAA